MNGPTTPRRAKLAICPPDLERAPTLHDELDLTFQSLANPTSPSSGGPAFRTMTYILREWTALMPEGPEAYCLEVISVEWGTTFAVGQFAEFMAMVEAEVRFNLRDRDLSLASFSIVQGPAHSRVIEGKYRYIDTRAIATFTHRGQPVTAVAA